MNSTEKIEDRKKRVDMHNFFIAKIDDAMENKRYIEASWLIYSCLENRYFRTIEKIKSQCKYSGGKCKKSSNALALRTKIVCVQRLANDTTCECFFNNFPDELFEKTKKWVKARNNLMHNLLQLEYYENMETEFEEIAFNGKALLDQTYTSCTRFREEFYTDGYTFVFPESAMERCSCKPRKETEE